MGFANFAVRRPVTIMMLYAGIFLLGLISWSFLPQEFYPPITFPQLTIKTAYKDAAPEEIELLITKPIEEVVGTVPGLKRITSTSKEETSLVMAEFDWGSNMDFAALHVREKIDLVKEKLPRGAEDPVVLKYNPFERPVMVLNVTSKKGSARKPYDLLQFTKKQIKNELEKVEGVAAVTLSGGLEREIVVEVDQARLAAADLSIVKISDALSKSNLNFPAGTIEETFYEYLVRAMGEFKLVPEISNVVIDLDKKESSLWRADRTEYESEPEREAKRKEKEAHRRVIYLGDVADVKDTFKEKTSYSRFNGTDTLSLSIQKQAGGFTLEVAKNVKKALAALKKDLPDDINITVVFDQSIIISQAINGVRDAAVQGGILAFLVLFFFLRSFRNAFIVALTIPLSILATFSLMYFCKISLNQISLGGLALGVGMLVDNGIVVIENVFRHRQLGEPAKDSTIVGTDEVIGAVNASTLTTVCVFLPMIFVLGIVGQFFKELALTITFSLLASLVIAFTLVPVLASKEKEVSYVGTEKETGLFALFEKKLRDFMMWTLYLVLNNKAISFILAFALFCLSVFYILTINRELLPRVDTGQFMVKVTMLPGTRVEVTNRIASKVEKLLLKYPETLYTTVNVGSTKEEEKAESIETLGPNQGQILITLKPKAKFGKFGKSYRYISTSELVQKLKNDVEKENLEGGEPEYVLQETELASAFQAGAPVVLEIKGNDLNVLEDLAQQVKEKIKTIKGIYGIKDSIVPPSPETKVRIFKDKAAEYNLSVSDIALTSQTAIKGFVATKFKHEGREIDVRVRLRPQDRKDFYKVRQLLVHSPLGIDVPLGDVATLGIGKGPTEIKRIGQQRTVLVSANLYKRGLSDAIKEIDENINTIKKPEGYSIIKTGEYEQTQKSNSSLVFLLILAVLLNYMIMAGQFESFWQPFVIMFTFPLCVIGVAAALFITHTPLSIMVMLGIIILTGIIVNNGIVLVDYANLLRNKGLSAHDAIIESCQTRMRPVFMTALTTLLGLLPLTFGLAEGTEVQIPMALTIMGGLFLGTFLTLNLIPAIYLVVDGFLEKFRKQEARVQEPPKTGKIEIAEEEENAEAVIAPEIKPIIIEEKPTPKPIAPFVERPIVEIKPIGIEKPKPVEKAPAVKEKKKKQAVLNKRQEKAVAYLEKKGKISRVEYAKIFKCSIATAGRDLKDLVDQGVIEGIGPYAVGRYYELKG